MVIKGNKVKRNSTVRARFALLRAFLLLALALACVPSVAYATEDMGGGFSGSGGGDFWQNLRLNFDFENTDWYIGSVWDSVFGGGGGHAFSGTGSGTGTTTSTQGTGGVYTLQRSITCASANTGYGMTVNGSVKLFSECPEYVKVTLNSDIQSLVNARLSAGSGLLLYVFGTNGSTNTVQIYTVPVAFTYSTEVISNHNQEVFRNNSGSAVNVTYTMQSVTSTTEDFNYNVTKTTIDNPNYSVSNGSYISNTKFAGRIVQGGYYLYIAPDGTPSNTGGGGTGTSTEEPVYPSDNPDYPTPNTYTEPDTSLPTVGTQTTTTGDTTVVTDVDLGPVTARQDVTNGLLYGIGSDLGNMYNMVWTEFDQFEREIYDLGDLLSDYLRTDTALLAAIGYTLDDIHTAMGNLDQDTDAIDLTGVTSKLDDLITALGTITPYDDTNLITTIENAAYDDSALVAAITGSHGSDVLGLFGRIDVILNWLDTYIGFDDAELLTLVENIYDALNNMQDEDTNVTTIRGDVRGIYNQISDGIMHQLGDLTESDGEVLTVRGLLHWIHYYIQDIDRALHDWPEYPSSFDASAIVQYLSDSLDELREFANDFVAYWSAIISKLDEAINAIESLDFGTRWPSGGAPERPTPNQLVQYVDWVEWDNAVETLMHKFPFVIVNDIALIFAALTRPAITPVFDLPMPNPSDWSTPYLVHVDLSDWDTVAAVMRVGIMLWVISRVSRRTLALFTRDEGAAA